jgi:DNA-binding PadR family transcriptional regulator
MGCQTGTLYAVLDRLREAGLIVVDREEIVESRLRRYYALTDAGTGPPREKYFTELADIRSAGRRLTEEEWIELWARHDQYPA